MNIGEHATHIRNIYKKGELTPEATHKESLSVRPQAQVQPSATVRRFPVIRHEGSRQVFRSAEQYNLERLYCLTTTCLGCRIVADS